MTKKEKSDFAIQVAEEVINALLPRINNQGIWEPSGEWIFTSTEGDMDAYDLHQQDLEEEFLKRKHDREKITPLSKKEKTEEELIGEVASLMTQLGMHVQKEEYEKCAIIHVKMKDIKKTLKDKYNIDLEDDGE
jgi:hypothetical protein